MFCVLDFEKKNTNYESLLKQYNDVIRNFFLEDFIINRKENGRQPYFFKKVYLFLGSQKTFHSK